MKAFHINCDATVDKFHGIRAILVMEVILIFILFELIIFIFI